VIYTSAIVLTILSQSSWMSTCISGLYIIFHKSPKQKVHGCQTGWVWNVAAKKYPPSLECLIRVLHYISVIVRRRTILMPNHNVYTQLWNKEVFQHIEEHMIHNCSLGLKKMVHKHVFCLQHRKHWPCDCPAHVWHLVADSVIPRWLDYDDSPPLVSER
jgi:hypothetical protein